MNISDDSFAQMLMHDVIRECANLVATIATLNGSRVAIPNLSDVFLAQLVQALKEKEVPSRVIADMLEISRTSLYRIDAPDFVTSTSTASLILLALAKSAPVTKPELMQELSSIDAEPILSALHHLKEIGTVVEIDGKLVCPRNSPNSTDGVEDLILLLAAEWAPISVDDLSAKFENPRENILDALERLALDEKIVMKGDVLQSVSGSIEIIADDPRRMYSGLMFVFRGIVRTTKKRLTDFPNSSGRMMSWTFSRFNEQRIVERLSALSDELDQMWRENEHSADDEDEITINLSWG